MNMINFAVEAKRESELLVKARRLTKIITTVVLAGYVVTMAAILGWLGVQSARERQQVNEAERLQQWVAQLSVQEATIRKMEDRARGVNEFLQSRVEMGEVGQLLTGQQAAVTAWSFEAATGWHTVTVKAPSAEHIEELTDQLEGSFSGVRLEKIGFAAGSWEGVVSFGGIKS